MIAEAENPHRADGPYRTRGGWKANCFGCDYWTGYTSEPRAERMIADHVRTKNEAAAAKVATK